METENKNKPGKRFLSTIGAGVIGSVLTLAVVVNTDLLQGEFRQKRCLSLQIRLPIMCSKQALKITPSLSDMVEQSSGAIVGIVNYQNADNRFFQQDGSAKSGSGSGVIYKIEGDKALS